MRVLAIEAHYDDVELGCGGTLIKHRDQGDELFILAVTHSSYEQPNGHRRTREAALAEGRESAARLGAELVSLDMEPLVLTPTEEKVLQIEKVVNQIRPDRVYTHHASDVHADHAAIGYMSIRACRKVNDIFLYRSNWYINQNNVEDNFYVDISSEMKEKIELINIFKSEITKVNNSWVDFVTKQNCASGSRIGMKYAETFLVLKSVWI